MKQTLGHLIEAARIGTGHPTPDSIAAVLRGAITAGVLPGGEPLRQVDLAEAFGVSPIPVREALRQLESHGFVTFHRNRGAVVSEISENEICENFEIRLALEPVLLGMAMPAAKPADFAAARTALREFDSENDVHRWGTLNWQFHRALYVPANRPRMLAILQQLHEQIDRFLRLQMSLSIDGKARSRREHQRIIVHCERGNVAGAQAALADHIRGVQAMILDFSKRRAQPSLSAGLQRAAKPKRAAVTNGQRNSKGA